MELKITFSLLCLAVFCHLAAASPKEADYKYNASEPNYVQGCCPSITAPSALLPHPGFQATFQPYVGYGTCASHQHTELHIIWGDGTDGRYPFDDPLYAHQSIPHQYPQIPGKYVVTAYYCSTPSYPQTQCCTSVQHAASITG